MPGLDEPAHRQLPLSGSENGQAQLFSYLQNRQLLLILDNSEHLVAEAGLLLHCV